MFYIEVEVPAVFEIILLQLTKRLGSFYRHYFKDSKEDYGTFKDRVTYATWGTLPEEDLVKILNEVKSISPCLVKARYTSQVGKTVVI